MNRDQIERTDLLRAAIHEAAHAVVDLRTGGIGGNIELYRVEGGGLDDIKVWAGRFHGFRIADHVAVGLAGSLAEAIHEEGGPDATTAEDVAVAFMDWLDCEVIELSDTDAAMLGGYGHEDVERTARLLFANWPDILARAQWEVQKANL